jgi:tRNA synthetases class I (E and Q), catalytic domain
MNPMPVAPRTDKNLYNKGLPLMDRDTPHATIAGLERDPAPPADFIRAIVTDDVKAGRNEGRVATRFPPEPNGYLYIGHAKSICLNFGIAAEFAGVCNLRFDDTNPVTEDVEYVRSIETDVRWLGFAWAASRNTPQTTSRSSTSMPFTSFSTVMPTSTARARMKYGEAAAR